MIAVWALRTLRLVSMLVGTPSDLASLSNLTLVHSFVSPLVLNAGKPNPDSVSQDTLGPSRVCT